MQKFILKKSIKTEHIKINKDENLTYIAILKKGWDKPKKLTFDLNGPEAKLTFLALIIGTNDEKFLFETLSNHNSKNTNANFYIRSVMFDKSEINFHGNLNVTKDAAQTNCFLSHHTLMLSKDTKTQTIPSMEIKANDVKAGHAATIGKIDEELLYYMESRGIDKKTGEKLLIKGFLEADLKKIKCLIHSN